MAHSSMRNVCVLKETRRASMGPRAVCMCGRHARRPNIEGISQGMAEGRCEEVLFSRGASLAPGAEGVSREGGGSMLCCVMGRPNEAPINDAVVELAQPPSVVGGRADWGPGNM